MRESEAGTVLILGGTAEARALAAQLVAAGRPVVSSLAGRVRHPALPVGQVRIGGFSSPAAGTDGVTGLADFLTDHRIGALVDATHPFAATISAHAAAAAARTGVPLLRLTRPGWRTHPDAERWTWVDSAAAAVRAGQDAARPLLTTGRQTLADYLDWADKEVTVRVVEAPEVVLPPSWRLIRSRGPYPYADERTLMHQARTDLLVTKDSGGTHTAAKLEVARDLGIPVVVLGRPPAPVGVPQVDTVAAVIARLAATA